MRVAYEWKPTAGSFTFLKVISSITHMHGFNVYVLILSFCTHYMLYITTDHDWIMKKKTDSRRPLVWISARVERQQQQKKNWALRMLLRATARCLQQYWVRGCNCSCEVRNLVCLCIITGTNEGNDQLH